MFSFSFSNQEMHNVCHNKFDRQRTFLVPAETVETISLQCLGNFQILYWIFGIPSVFLHGLPEFCWIFILKFLELSSSCETFQNSMYYTCCCNKLLIKMVL